MSSTEKLNREREAALFEVTVVIKELLCSVGITGSVPKPRGVWISPTASSQQCSSLEPSLLQELSHPAQSTQRTFPHPSQDTLWPPTHTAILNA